MLTFVLLLLQKRLCTKSNTNYSETSLTYIEW
nr:MAG TPA: hypothetical protein [Caudoviricetes sp.]